MPSGIITVGLVYKRSVDIGTENFSIALEEIISSLDPNIKTYIMGDFNINIFDYSTSPAVENFLNLMLIIICLDFLPTPRRGSHVKSDNSHTHSHQDTPLSPYT